jgi:hypothetical protein
LGGDSEKFLTGLLTLSLITVMFFSPWFIIWAVFLFREGRPAQSGRREDYPPASHTT